MFLAVNVCLYEFIEMHSSYSYCALNSEPQPLAFVKNLERNDGHSEKCWESQSSSVLLGGQCINLIWQTHSSTREKSCVYILLCHDRYPPKVQPLLKGGVIISQTTKAIINSLGL